MLIFIIFQFVWLLRYICIWLVDYPGFGPPYLFIWGYLLLRGMASFFSSMSKDIRNSAHGFVRAVWTVYFGAMNLIKREPRLPFSTGTGGKDCFPKVTERSQTIAASPAQMAAAAVATPPSKTLFESSTLNQQREEKKIKTSKPGEHLAESIQRKVETTKAQRMKETGLVSFDMLWAVLSPGQKVVYKCKYTQALLCATIAEEVTCRTHSPAGKVYALRVLLDVHNYNGRKYQRCTIRRDVSKFEGERMCETLPL